MRNNKSTKSSEPKTPAKKKPAPKKPKTTRAKFHASELVLKSPAYLYCKEAVRQKTTPKYVKLQMRDFMKICEGKDKKYKISEAKVRQVEAILKILVMPKGLKAGQSLYSCTCGYQWLFYIAILCTVYRDNPQKRRYETGVLEICRKNFKTYTVATIFIILRPVMATFLPCLALTFIIC